MNKVYKFTFVLLSVSLASFIIWLSYRPYLGIDDAYIYFVYAKNIAHGHGFVYNIGGERVEGFTSMLWVLICSLFYKLSDHYFRQGLAILNILTVSFALYRLVDFVDRRFIRYKGRLISFPSFCLLAVLFVVKGYLDWTILSLLETGLWSSFLIVLVVHLLELCYEPPSRREPFVFGVLLFFLVLIRPESLLLSIVFMAIRFALYWNSTRTLGKPVRASLPPLAIFIAAFAGLVLFRLKYFGYPFPNTYYAKVSSDTIGNIKEGFIYLFKFIFVYPVYIIPIVVLLLSLWTWVKLLFTDRSRLLIWKEEERAQLAVVLIVGVALLIPMMVGGDHFSLFRIYQPFIPIFWILLLNTDFIRGHLVDIQVKRLPGLIGNRLLWLGCALPVLYLMDMPKYFVDPNKIPYKISLLNDFSFPESYKKVSVELNDFFPFSPKPSIGRIWAGAYAFGYDGATVDLMGLNDTLMAHASKIKVGLKNHASFNKSAFYKLGPDFVDGNFITEGEAFGLPENRADFDEKSFESNVMKGIFRDTAFITMYQPVLISRLPIKEAFFTYTRRDYIPFLEQKGFRVRPLERVHPPAYKKEERPIE